MKSNYELQNFWLDVTQRVNERCCLCEVSVPVIIWVKWLLSKPIACIGVECIWYECAWNVCMFSIEYTWYAVYHKTWFTFVWCNSTLADSFLADLPIWIASPSSTSLHAFLIFTFIPYRKSHLPLPSWRHPGYGRVSSIYLHITYLFSCYIVSPNLAILNLLIHCTSRVVMMSFIQGYHNINILHILIS